MVFEFPWGKVDEDELGGFLSEVATECGTDAVDFLCARFGGASLNVPKRSVGIDELDEAGNFHGWLREVAENFSVELAAKIVALRGGEQIYVRVPGKLRDAAKRRKIRREYDGENAGDLAVKYKLPRRTVLRYALSKPKQTTTI